MSAMDVGKDPNIEKVKKKKREGVKQPSSKDKRLFGKIRAAIKKNK
jgi:hypothetical protein